MVSGRDLFDAMVFRDDVSTRIFYTFMAELRASILQAEPTATHRFIKLIQDRGRLVRNYTQNIDGLEARTGLDVATDDVRQNQVLQLHGDLHTLKCSVCAYSTAFSAAHLAQLRDGDAPACPQCTELANVRAVVGKRGATQRVGVMRPNIVMYGEPHPCGEFIGKATRRDIAQGRPDLLLVMGTSLRVSGIKRLVKDIAGAVHERGGKVVYVNATAPARSEWVHWVDYHVQGDSDQWVEDLRKRKPYLWLKQTKLNPQKMRRRVRAAKAEGASAAPAAQAGASGGKPADPDRLAASPRKRVLQASQKVNLPGGGGDGELMASDKSDFVTDLGAAPPTPTKRRVKKEMAELDDFSLLTPPASQEEPAMPPPPFRICPT